MFRFPSLKGALLPPRLSKNSPFKRSVFKRSPFRPSPLLLAALCLGVLAAPAPAHAVEVDGQKWEMFTLQKELSDRWRAYFEVQPRIGADFSRFDRLLVRPALGYRITRKLSVWQGYAWTPAFEPFNRDEHRSFQQFLYEDRFSDWSLVSRTRFEERFIEDAGDTAYRFRTMLRLSHPFTRDKRWYGIVYDELFWNLNTVSNGPVSGFDRNRIFLGVGREVSKELRVETGYLLENVNSPDGIPNRRHNVWLTSFNWRL